MDLYTLQWLFIGVVAGVALAIMFFDFFLASIHIRQHREKLKNARKQN